MSAPLTYAMTYNKRDRRFRVWAITPEREWVMVGKFMHGSDAADSLAELQAELPTIHDVYPPTQAV